jgi:hypothetical protein
MWHRNTCDYDRWRAEGHDAYFEGLTLVDAPYSTFDGLRWSWWVAGWRQAREEDQHIGASGPDNANLGVVINDDGTGF